METNFRKKVASNFTTDRSYPMYWTKPKSRPQGRDRFLRDKIYNTTRKILQKYWFYILWQATKHLILGKRLKCFGPQENSKITTFPVLSLPSFTTMTYTNNKINLLWKPLQKQDVYMFSHDELKKSFLLDEELIFFHSYIIFIFVWVKYLRSE